MLNSEVRKEYAMFLHKATSYLQIILEQQHRAKWEEKEKKRRKERRGEKGDRRDEGRLKYSGFRKGKGRKHTKINTEVSLASQPGASLVHLSMIQQMPSQISPS